jgi:hypothetical protein
MELSNLKQAVLTNLQSSLTEASGNDALEPLIADAIKNVEGAETSIEIQNIMNVLSEKVQKISDEIKEATKLEIAPEVEEIAEILKQDYLDEIAKWQWYTLMKSDFFDPENPNKTEEIPILQEDPENPGRYSYTANYNGKPEADGQGENFTSQEFTMPTLNEVLSMLTPEHVKLYKEMQEAGEEPKLQLVPVALQIRTLGQAINAKRDRIKINTEDTYVWDEINDHQLIYEPTTFVATSDGRKLQTSGGIGKSQFIKQNQGWTIEIIPTVQSLTEKKPGTNAQKTEQFMSEVISKGYRGCTFESNLSAQMTALKKTPPEPLETQSYTIVPDSSLTDQGIIAAARWSGDQVRLDWNGARSDDDNLRFRRLVRVTRQAKPDAQTS